MPSDRVPVCARVTLIGYSVPSSFDGTFVYEIQAAADVPVPTLSGTGFLVFAILLAGLGLLTIGRNTIS